MLFDDFVVVVSLKLSGVLFLLFSSYSFLSKPLLQSNKSDTAPKHENKTHIIHTTKESTTTLQELQEEKEVLLCMIMQVGVETFKQPNKTKARNIDPEYNSYSL